jgi:hypothetical protein
VERTRQLSGSELLTPEKAMPPSPARAAAGGHAPSRMDERAFVSQFSAPTLCEPGSIAAAVAP